MKQKSYNQLCGMAYALDIVGERWTLLIIRELIAGPRRFKDLVDGLPSISTNLLSERLKELEHSRMIARRVLPPPAGSTVYELTELARALEPTLLELGRWGSQFVPAAPEGVHVLHLGSYALTLKTFFREELARGVHETYMLHIGNEVLHVRIADGAISVEQGEARDAAVALRADDTLTYLALLGGELQPEQALEQGLIQVTGDVEALRRFLRICGLPGVEDKQSEPVAA